MNTLFSFSTIFVLCICLAMPCVLANENSSQPKEHAETILQDIHNTLSQHQSVAGAFTQSRKSGDFNAALLSSGRYIYLRQQGLYWEVNAPFFIGNTFEDQAVTEWESPGVQSNSTNISGQPSSMQHIGNIISSILQGEFADLEKHFTISSRYSEQKQWVLTLLPKVKVAKKFLKHITLQGGAQLKKITIETPGGDLTEINLTVETRNTPLSTERCQLFPHLTHTLCQF